MAWIYIATQAGLGPLLASPSSYQSSTALGASHASTALPVCGITLAKPNHDEQFPLHMKVPFVRLVLSLDTRPMHRPSWKAHHSSFSSVGQLRTQRYFRRHSLTGWADSFVVIDVVMIEQALSDQPVADQHGQSLLTRDVFLLREVLDCFLNVGREHHGIPISNLTEAAQQDVA